jgi:hypothetical protein
LKHFLQEKPVKLLERKVILATLSPRKRKHIGGMLDELVGPENWGVATDVLGSLIGFEAAHKLVERLIDEPSPDLFAAELEGRLTINPNTDALGKTIGVTSALINALPAMSQYWTNDGDVLAYQVVGTDAMSGFLTREQVEKIEITDLQNRRQVIDEMIAKKEIKFNNKATSESMDLDILKMEQASGLLVLAVVKGMGVITGIKKYETIMTPIVGSAFLYAAKFKEGKKELIAEEMKRDGIGIPSGIHSENIHFKGLSEMIYCGKLNRNENKLHLSLAGKPLDDVEAVVRRNDDNIRQELATRAIEVDSGILLGDKVDSLTDAGFAMARLGRHLKRIREERKVEIKEQIKSLGVLQRFVINFNKERGISETRDIVFEKLKGEIDEFDCEVQRYINGPNDKVRADLAREIADVVVFLAKLSNYLKLDLDKYDYQDDGFHQDQSLKDLSSRQNILSDDLARNLQNDELAGEKVVEMIRHAFQITRFLGYDFFDIVTRKCQRNVDKYDADTTRKLMLAGLKPVVAEACVKSLWDKKLDEIYFL